MNALERGDAQGAARIFSADARLLVAMVDSAVVGREDIAKFWQGAMNGGLKALKLTTIDLEGDGVMRVETGDYAAIGAGGAEIGRGHYLFVWRKESGEWKIFRDMGNASPAPVAGGMDAFGCSAAYRGRRVSRAIRLDVRDARGRARGQERPGTTTYVNSLAATVRNIGQIPYPNGAVMVMEYALSLKDGEGELLRDSQGALLKGEVVRVDVMRRGRGFGEPYGDKRAGDWEFSSYRRDGSALIAPDNGVALRRLPSQCRCRQGFRLPLRAPLAAQ